MRFSERHSFKPVKSAIQLNSMDGDLRNSLWNTLTKHYWKRLGSEDNRNSYTSDRDLLRLFEALWEDYFKKPTDSLPRVQGEVYDVLREYFFKCEWYEVYDFVEFVSQRYLSDYATRMFHEDSNQIFKREISGYRFVGDLIVPITSEEEIASIQNALDNTAGLTPVHNHILAALRLLSDKKKPDFRNSIKESISAVEAICQRITGKSGATLGDALKVIEKYVPVHGALKDAFNKLYGYTSDAEGIRHAMLDESNLDLEDAAFFLVSCSAFINYLIQKANKAQLKLT